jgi:hypothetical protein
MTGGFLCLLGAVGRFLAAVGVGGDTAEGSGDPDRPHATFERHMVVEQVDQSVVGQLSGDRDLGFEG